MKREGLVRTGLLWPTVACSRWLVIRGPKSMNSGFANIYISESSQPTRRFNVAVAFEIVGGATRQMYTA